MLYFAYGINVNKDFLISLLGIDKVQVIGKGCLRGYTLKLCAKDRDGFVWLGLVSKESSVVWGRVYEVLESAVEVLNEYEDVPEVYLPQILPVEINGETKQSLVYVNRSCGIGKLDKEYALKVMKGLEDFPEDWRAYVYSLFNACSF